MACNEQLAAPIPFAATVARGLRALSIHSPEQLEAQDWLDLEWKLHCFPKLEVGAERVQGSAGMHPACLLRALAPPSGPVVAAAPTAPSLPSPCANPQLLCVEPDVWASDSVIEALQDLIWSNFSFKLEIDGNLREHPRYSGLADFS